MAKRRRSKLRVMVDANILFAAVGWRRWPYEVLRHAIREDYQLVLSQRIIAEVTEELKAISPNRLGSFKRLLAMLKPEIVPEPSEKQIAKQVTLLPDQDDVPIALAAINAGVDYFVTEDKHFTTRDETRAALHRQLKIMLAGRFLREVMGWTSEELERVRQRE